jgi:hypothetical protein
MAFGFIQDNDDVLSVRVGPQPIIVVFRGAIALASKLVDVVNVQCQE